MRFIHGFILIVFRSLFMVVDAQGKFVYKDAANNITICYYYNKKMEEVHNITTNDFRGLFLAR